MTDPLKPYPAYKDSGLPWLGNIPVHWQMRRLKGLVRNVNQVADSKKEGGFHIGLENIESWTGRLRLSSKESEFTSQVKSFEIGDILFGKLRPYLAKVTQATFAGACVSELLVLRAFNLDLLPKFLEYILRSSPFIHLVNSSTYGAKMPRAEWPFIGNVVIAYPPPDEQAAIVRFLDHANRRIDRYIRTKRKLITLLNEQKQAIIHQAVTRGLDPNVRLKPSGVEWLGEIPAHWESLPVRRLVSVVTSGSRGWAQYYSDTGHIFLQSGNLGRSMSLNLSFIQYVDPPEGSEGIRTIVQPNDVLVCVTGALTGNVALVDVDLDAPAYVNQHVALIRPRPTAILPRYLAFALHSEVGRTQFKTNEYGGTKQGLGLEDVKSVFVPVPPISEQMAICSALDNQIAMFGTAITRTEREIALMREYRTRLVADVVTGQLDVRVAVANMPEPEGFDDEATEDWSEAENEEVDSEALAEAEIDAK